MDFKTHVEKREYKNSEIDPVLSKIAATTELISKKRNIKRRKKQF